MSVQDVSGLRPANDSESSTSSDPVAVHLGLDPGSLDKATIRERERDLQAAYPLLPLPLTPLMDLTFLLDSPEPKISSGTAALNQVHLQMMEIVTNSWKAFIKTERELSEKRRESSIKERQEDQIKEDVRIGNQQKEVKRLDQNQDLAQLSLFASGMLMTGLVPGLTQITEISLQPVLAGIQALALGGVIPTTLTALVTFLAAGAMLQAGLLTLVSAKGKEGQHINADYVEQYIGRVLKSINDTNLMSKLESLFGIKGEEGKPSQLIIQTKIVLLATALAFSYKAETGGLVGKEFAGLIGRELSLDPKDPKNKLILALNSQFLLLTESQQKVLKEKLFVYFDSPHSLEEFLEPARAIASIYSKKISSPMTA